MPNRPPNYRTSLGHALPVSSSAASRQRPCASPGVASRTATAQLHSSSSSTGAQAVPELTEDTRRLLRQTRSLFLCSRGLRSLRHIRHLELMTGLRSLCVHMNAIRRLEGLTALRHLVELDLSANELAALDADCFQSLQSLRRLNLSSNFLSTLGEEATWRPLRSLEWLSLGFNALVDIRALRGLPDVAPLLYVDLCGNRIAHIEQVEEALAMQRPHLQELRLETPKAMAALMLAESADLIDALITTNTSSAAVDMVTSGDPFATADAEATASSSAVLPLLLRENPCCMRASGQSEGNAASSASRGYAERLLEYFPRLTVLNGISYVLDPLQPSTLLLQQHEEVIDTAGAEAERRDDVVTALNVRAGHGKDALVRTPTARIVLLPPHAETSGPRSQATRRLSFALEKSAARSPAGRTECSHSLQHLSPAPYSEPESSTTSTTTTNSSNSTSRDAHCASTRVEPHAKEEDVASHRSVDAKKTMATVKVVEKSHNSDNPHNSNISATQLEHDLTPLYTPPRPYITTAMPHPDTAPQDSPHTAATTPRVTTAVEVSASTSGENKVAPNFTASSSSSSSNSACEATGLATVDAATLAMVRAGQPVRSLKWRPQRVSRGTNTASPNNSENDNSSETVSRMQTQMARIQEQLSLRVALETDLRRHLRLAQRRGDAVVQAAQLQACHARAQVTALKDELTRRAQEAAIVDKKYRAELAEQRRRLTARAAEEVQAALTPVQSELTDLRRVMAETQAAHTRQLAELQQGHEAALRDSAGRYEADMRAAAETHTRELTRMRVAAQHVHALLALQLAEAEARAVLQAEAASRAPCDESLTSRWATTVQRRCDERVAQCEATLRENYRAALEHAESEIQRLRAELTARSNATAMTSREVVEEDEAEVDMNTPVREKEAVTPPPLRPAVEEPWALYWRNACHAREAELAQVRQACRVANETQRVVAQENSRLLHRIAEVEREATATRTALTATAAKEKETLLRTVHNLEASLATKDNALDTLEAEAKAKLDEKRRRIAELEQHVETVRDELATCQRECAAARAAVGQAEQTSQALRERLAVAERQNSAPASAAAQQQQQQQLQQQLDMAAAERQRIVSALRLAREQLGRLHTSHAALLRAQDEYKAQLAEKEARLTALTRQLQEVQTSARVKQRATLEAFSRFLLANEAMPEA